MTEQHDTCNKSFIFIIHHGNKWDSLARSIWGQLWCPENWMQNLDISASYLIMIMWLQSHDQRILGSASLWVSCQPKKVFRPNAPALLKCWPSFHFWKVEKGGWLVGDLFPCLCYETKTAQWKDVARSNCRDNASNWSDAPAVTEYKGCFQLPQQG